MHVNTNCEDWDSELARRLLLEPARRLAREVPVAAGAGVEPHALHRVERLRHAAAGRAAARHPLRHELLLLAGFLDPGPARPVHRFRVPAALRDRGRRHDRRLPGRDADDRRVGPVVPGDDRHVARQRARAARLLRRVHREHPHRHATPAQWSAIVASAQTARRPAGLGPPDARLDRRSQRVVVRQRVVRRQRARLHRHRGRRRERAPGDVAREERRPARRSPRSRATARRCRSRP